jgi:hypothetical protein
MPHDIEWCFASSLVWLDRFSMVSSRARPVRLFRMPSERAADIGAAYALWRRIGLLPALNRETNLRPRHAARRHRPDRGYRSQRQRDDDPSNHRRCARSLFCNAGLMPNSSMAFLMAVSSSGASTRPSNAAGVPFSGGRGAADAWRSASSANARQPISGQSAPTPPAWSSPSARTPPHKLPDGTRRLELWFGTPGLEARDWNEASLDCRKRAK